MVKQCPYKTRTVVRFHVGLPVWVSGGIGRRSYDWYMADCSLQWGVVATALRCRFESYLTHQKGVLMSRYEVEQLLNELKSLGSDPDECLRKANEVALISATSHIQALRAIRDAVISYGVK